MIETAVPKKLSKVDMKLTRSPNYFPKSALHENTAYHRDVHYSGGVASSADITVCQLRDVALQREVIDVLDQLQSVTGNLVVVPKMLKVNGRTFYTEVGEISFHDFERLMKENKADIGRLSFEEFIENHRHDMNQQGRHEPKIEGHKEILNFSGVNGELTDSPLTINGKIGEKYIMFFDNVRFYELWKNDKGTATNALCVNVAVSSTNAKKVIETEDVLSTYFIERGYQPL